MESGTRFATGCVAFSLRNNFLTNVCSKVVELLNQKNIKVSSVDFVRFTWLNKKADQEIEEEEEDDDDDDEDDDGLLDEDELIDLDDEYDDADDDDKQHPGHRYDD